MSAPSHPVTPAPGAPDASSARWRVLGGRYLPRRLLGRGAVSEVVAATDLATGQEVAVKLLRAGSETDRRRLQREATLLRRLDHPGIVKVLDADVDDGEPFVVMELVRGPLLRRVLSHGPLPPRLVAVVGAELADALAHAHDRGVVHRDIKPSNVVIEDDGRPRLIDFGVACLLEGSAVTATGDVVGTIAYVAPEQVWQSTVDGAADVYSLGLVLLECATGMRAFRGSPAEQIAARLVTPPAVPPSVPNRLRSIIEGMTACEPGEREPARRVADDLRECSSVGGEVVDLRAPWPAGDRAPSEPAHDDATGPLPALLALVAGR